LIFPCPVNFGKNQGSDPDNSNYSKEEKMEEKDYIWDYLNPYDYMEKLRKGMPPVIISVAITGGIHGKEANPNLPESFDEQVLQVYDCYKAGASIVHVHARKKDNPSAVSADPSLFR